MLHSSFGLLHWKSPVLTEVKSNSTSERQRTHINCVSAMFRTDVWSHRSVCIRLIMISNEEHCFRIRMRNTSNDSCISTSIRQHSSRHIVMLCKLLRSIYVMIFERLLTSYCTAIFRNCKVSLNAIVNIHWTTNQQRSYKTKPSNHRSSVVSIS